jgi:uncharacterized glyoxalase superfamily protein PhnB
MARATAVTPILRYRNAGAAARWLCEAFGFQEHDRAQELDGHIRYVSLRFGDSTVLVRPVATSALDDFMVQPEAIGGTNTQVCYLTVPDVTSHHAHAEGAGAKIELKPHDDGLGGLFYTCRDLEDHLWSFGTRAYGVAQEAASNFQPVELGPSGPGTAVALLPGHTSHGPGRGGRLLRHIAILAASVVVAGCGWAFYSMYTQSAAREAAAASTATTARLDNTARELAQERSRRSAAESGSAEAAKKLAEERTITAELRQTLQRADAELAELRRDKREAVRALELGNQVSERNRLARDRAEAELAASKAQIAQAETKLAQLASEENGGARTQSAKDGEADLRLKEELQEAKTALLEANRTIEELRDGQIQPMVPESGDQSVADSSPCVQAVQGKVPSSHKGSNTWIAANLRRLCRGAEPSVEPAKCFEEIMRGEVSWGAGTTWVTANALALCGGTRSARRTLDCFKREISSSQTWQVAIRQCRSK